MRTKSILFFVLLLSLVIGGCGHKEKKEARIYNPERYEYHDDVAWVELSKLGLISRKYLGVVCIDKNGVEIFSIPDISKASVSNFYNGIALVDGRYIINKKGECLHDLTDELNVEIKMLPNSYFDGFIFVKQTKNDVEMTGILDSDFNWVSELTTKLNDIEVCGNFLYHNSAIGYYDVLEKEIIDEDEFRLRHFQRSFPDSGIIFIEIYPYKAHYFSTIAGGEINIEGIEKTGFYDRDLKLLIDLSNYSSVKILSDFQSNKCLIKFLVGEVWYTGLINLDGDFIFLDSGHCERHDEEKIEFDGYYYDWDGNYFIEETNEKGES